MKLSEKLWKSPYPVHDIEDAIAEYLKRKRKQYIELQIIYVIEYIVTFLFIFGMPSIIWECITSNVETEWIQKVIIILYGLIHCVIVLEFICCGDNSWEKSGVIPTLITDYEKSRYIWRDSIGIVLSEEIENQDKWLYALTEAAQRKCGERNLDGRLLPVYFGPVYIGIDPYIRDNKERIEYLWLKYNPKRRERKKAKEYFKWHILDKVRE
jgi:hypothetical protein